MAMSASKVENLVDRIARNAIEDRSREGIQHLGEEVLPLGVLLLNRIAHREIASIALMDFEECQVIAMYSSG
jgi:hypothetical protein